MQHHDGNAAHGCFQTPLVIEFVHKLSVMDHVVSDSHSDATDEIYAAVREVFEGCVAGLNGEDFCELLDHLHTQWILLLHGTTDDVMTVDLIRRLLPSTSLKDAWQTRVFLFHELVDERDSWSCSEPLVGHSLNFGLASLVLDIVRILNEVVSKLQKAHVLLIPRRELDMTTFGREHLIAGREFALYQETLPMSCSRTEHNFNTTLLDRGPIQSLVIFLLQLEQATIEITTERVNDIIKALIKLTVQQRRNH